MFWREKPKKKYYYTIFMKMKRNYLFPKGNQDVQLKSEGDIFVKAG
jgi:hypothetical protein